MPKGGGRSYRMGPSGSGYGAGLMGSHRDPLSSSQRVSVRKAAKACVAGAVGGAIAGAAGGAGGAALGAAGGCVGNVINSSGEK